MARRVMTESDARELYRGLCRVDNGVCVSGWLELRAHGHFSVLGLRVTLLSTSPATGTSLSSAACADNGFDAFWGTCNKELSFLGLDIRRVNLPPEPDEAPVRYVGVVNKVNDNLSKEASRMTPAQVALFRAIVRAEGGSPPARQQGRRAQAGAWCCVPCQLR